MTGDHQAPGRRRHGIICPVASVGQGGSDARNAETREGCGVAASETNPDRAVEERFRLEGCPIFPPVGAQENP